MAMSQEYGQWHLATPGPNGQVRYHLRWMHQHIEDGPNGPVRFWELFWEPGRPADLLTHS